MKKIIAGFVLLITICITHAQEQVWSLEKCFSIAMENNLEIKVKQLEVKKAQKNHIHPLLNMMPRVGLSGNHSYNFGSTIDPNTNNRVSSDIQWDNFALNANMAILDFNSIALARKNRTDVEVAKANKAVVEYEYKMQLLASYFDALYSQELVRIQKEQLKNSRFNLERIEKEVQIGSKPQSDWYDMQLSFSQEDKRLLETEQLYLVQKTQLFQLMNYPVSNTDEVMLLLEPVKETSTFTSTSVQANPRVIWAELNYESSRKNIFAQRAGNLPSLEAFYSMSSFYSNPLNQPNGTVPGFSSQLDNNKNHQVGVQLSIPIFNGVRKSRQIAVSKIEAEQYKVLSEQEKIKIEQQVALEQTKRQQFQAMVDKLDTTLLYAKESFRTTQSKFTSGKVDAVTFTSVKNQLISSEYEVLKNALLLQFVTFKINLLQKAE